MRDVLIAKGIDSSRIVFAIYGKDGMQRATHAEDRGIGIVLPKQSVTSVIVTTFVEHGNSGDLGAADGADRGTDRYIGGIAS